MKRPFERITNMMQRCGPDSTASEECPPARSIDRCNERQDPSTHFMKGLKTTENLTPIEVRT